MFKRLFSSLLTLLVLTAVLVANSSAWFVGADPVDTEASKPFNGFILPTLEYSLDAEDNITFVEPEELTAYHGAASPNARSVDIQSFPRFSTVEDAAEYYKQCIKSRSEFGYRITVNIPNASEQWKDYSSKYYHMVLDAAGQHNGKPDEGDYLRQYTGVMLSASLVGNTVKEVIVYSDLSAYPYYSTAEQERQVGPAIDSLINELGLNNGKSDYEKIQAVYEWMISHIRYDYDNLNNDSYRTKHGAYAAIINKTSVCSGYALLYYRIMLTLGIDCRYITGLADANDPTSYHAWNIVLLDGKYYLIDTTWEACNYFAWQDKGLEWTERTYFLRGSIYDGFAKRKSDSQFLTAEFTSKYPISVCGYNRHETELVEEKEVDCVHNGYTGDLVCTICGEVVEKGSVIKAPGHDYNESGICIVCGFDRADVLPGDINGDGEIDITDSVLLFRYLVGIDDDNTIVEACDFNEDGEIDSLDSVLLLRYLVGLR